VHPIHQDGIVLFAFETTLASRTFAPMLVRWKAAGYQTHVVFLWLPSADLALARVRERVRPGGHDVPAETVVRRHGRGLRNFVELYRPRAHSWRVLDNAGVRPRLIAEGAEGRADTVHAVDAWQRFCGAAR